MRKVLLSLFVVAVVFLSACSGVSQFSDEALRGFYDPLTQIALKDARALGIDPKEYDTDGDGLISMEESYHLKKAIAARSLPQTTDLQVWAKWVGGTLLPLGVLWGGLYTKKKIRKHILNSNGNGGNGGSSGTSST